MNELSSLTCPICSGPIFPIEGVASRFGYVCHESCLDEAEAAQREVAAA